MPVDMKETIADAAKRLMFDRNVKKITVKDIVAECQITRQTFYYHFEDIPALIQWELEKNMNRLLQEIGTQDDWEKGIKYLFLAAINGSPYLKRGMRSNYREEIERLLIQYTYKFFEQIIEQRDLYQSCSHSEVKLVVRYHSQAVLGILREWTEEDTKNLDQIVHEVYRLIMGEISPFQ